MAEEFNFEKAFASLQETLIKAVDGKDAKPGKGDDDGDEGGMYKQLLKAIEGNAELTELVKAKFAKTAGPGNTTSADVTNPGYASKDPDLGTRLKKMEDTQAAMAGQLDTLLKAMGTEGALTKSITTAIEANAEPLRDALSSALDRLAQVEGQTTFQKSLTGQDGAAGAYANQAGIANHGGQPGMFDQFVRDLAVKPNVKILR